MRKMVLIILTFLSLVALFIRFGLPFLIKYLGLEAKAGVRIESSPKAKVFINNKDRGLTPFQDEGFSAGEYLVSLLPIESTDSGKWVGYVKLNGGTLTVVNRELNRETTKSSGEVISLEKGSGATVVSVPSGAEVMVDGKEVGRTPILLSELLAGEHQFLIGKENFLKRSIRVTVVEGYNLNLMIDLALSEPDLTRLPIVPQEQTLEVVVKKTPTGYLNVRGNPTTSAQIIGKVFPGESLVLLEELLNWDRVRIQDGKEGYVSSRYVEKKNP